MKIALIMPYGAIHRHSGIFGKALRYAPLTLTTLAGYVPNELNAEISLYDEGVAAVDFERIDADIVGITCITGTSYRAYAIADRLRAKGMTVVLGGVHPTLLPDEAAKHADAVVTGLAEESWPQLLTDFRAGALKTRYTQSPTLKLDNLPLPRRDLLDRSKYVLINSLQATRGCPFKCKFCVVPVTSNGYLSRPIPEVIAEIEQFEGRHFLFIDVSPIDNPVYIKALYRELAPLKKRWGGLATVRIVEDLELLDLAVKAGCGGLLIGLESVSQESLNLVAKGFNKVSDFMEMCHILHDNGIAINGCFVLGLDGDDESVFERTVDFALKAHIDLPRFAVYTPFPGTSAFKELHDQGRILTYDWSLYDVEHVVFRPKLMSPERLQEGLHWTWEQTYKMSSIAKRLAGSRLALPFSIPANLAYRHLARYLPNFDASTLVNAVGDGL
jgi:radical SAM superfamily enzyme YgiQ (UPF0313 family)